MKTSLWSALPLCLALVACTNSSNNSANTDGVMVPKSLEFSKPIAGAPLTKDQANEIKNTFQTKSMMILPPGELVFPDKNMPKWEKERKEQELARTDANSFQLLQDLRAGCAKAHPKVSFNATFPTDAVTETNAVEILQKGDLIDWSASAGLMGANCPVDLTGSTAMGAEIKSVDADERKVSASSSAGLKLTAVMKNPRYAALLGTRGVIVDTSLSGVAIRREVQKGFKDSALVTFNLAGTYLSLKADIPYSTETRALVNSNGKDDVKTEIVSTTSLNFPSFSASLVVHANIENEKTLSQNYYLNGHQMTVDELNELFGTNAPNAVIQTKQISTMLMN